MKKLILLAGVAALAACGDTATEEAAPAEEAEMDGMMEPAAEEEMTAPDGGPMEGTYSLRDMDGNEVGVTTISADGSYTYTETDGEPVMGSVRMGDEGACFDPEGDDPEVCFPDGGMSEDGDWIRVDPDGNEVGTIVRVEA